MLTWKKEKKEKRRIRKKKIPAIHVRWEAMPRILATVETMTFLFPTQSTAMIDVRANMSASNRHGESLSNASS